MEHQYSARRPTFNSTPSASRCLSDGLLTIKYLLQNAKGKNELRCKKAFHAYRNR